MITRIELRKFRGFKEFACAVSPTTVFMGPNSSGKTTVLHAIRVAFDVLGLAAASAIQLKLDGTTIRQVRQGLIETPSSLLPLADWNALFLDQAVGQGSSFEIVITFGGALVSRTLGCNCHVCQQQPIEIQGRTGCSGYR